MAIEPETFRALFRGWPTGVSVVTCRDAAQQGRVRGMTVGSLTSVSLDPPLLLFCVHRDARTNGLIRAEGVFGVHLLDVGQRELSDRCAGFLGEEAHWLDDLPMRAHPLGAPVLSDSAAWAVCRLCSAHEAGDHVVFTGHIEELSPGRHDPLLWFNGTYRQMSLVEVPGARPHPEGLE